MIVIYNLKPNVATQNGRYIQLMNPNLPKRMDKEIKLRAKVMSSFLYVKEPLRQYEGPLTATAEVFSLSLYDRS